VQSLTSVMTSQYMLLAKTFCQCAAANQTTIIVQARHNLQQSLAVTTAQSNTHYTLTDTFLLAAHRCSIHVTYHSPIAQLITSSGACSSPCHQRDLASGNLATSDLDFPTTGTINCTRKCFCAAVHHPIDDPPHMMSSSEHSLATKPPPWR